MRPKFTTQRNPSLTLIQPTPEDPFYYTTKAPEYHNATYAGPSYYSEAPKYYSAPSYYTTKAFGYYTPTYASSVYERKSPKY
jgi:hypothetical protein